MRRNLNRGPFAIALTLALAACHDQPAAPTPPPVTPAPDFAPRDVLAEWRTRFADVPPGATDATLPELSASRVEELAGMFATATSSARQMARFKRTATENLHAAGVEAIVALGKFTAECGMQAGREAFAVIAEAPRPELATACIAWLEDGPEWRRVEAARTLGTTSARHAIPRLLRRLKYELDQPAELTIAVCRALAELGNAAGIPALVQHLGSDATREPAGQALVRVLEIFGPAYEEADGWSGLERKARGVHARWEAAGTLGEHEESPLLQRELWLFLKELGGDPLRPVDEARFVARHAGVVAVPLLGEALSDANHYVRVHVLEVLRDLGRVAHATGPKIHALTRDPVCRGYALEALGAVGAEPAIDVLCGLLIVGRDDPRAPVKSATAIEDRVSALKGLMHLGDPSTLPLLLTLQRDAESDEVKVWAAAALMRVSAAARDQARGYLEGALERGEYHAPTLRELLAR